MSAVIEDALIMETNPVRVINFDMHPEVVAYCCAEMPTHWYLAMRMKWADDWSGASALEKKLWLTSAKIAHRNGWRLPKGREYLRRMSGLAIHEMAEPARYRLPDAWLLRSAWLGTGKTQWFTTWSERYNKIFQELNEWTNRAYRWMKVHPQYIARKRREPREPIKQLRMVDVSTRQLAIQMEDATKIIEPFLNIKALNRQALELKK